MTGNIQLGWAGLAIKVIMLFGSLASLAALIGQRPAPFELSILGWSLQCPEVLVALTVAFAGGLIFLEVRAHGTYHRFRIDNQKSINRYMYRWIRRGGRVAIWTHDMTWASDDPKVKKLLIAKACRKELVICINQPIALTRCLKQKGACVYIYGSHLATRAMSRFTITHYEGEGSRVAVGRAVGDHHIIEEFAAGHHPAHSIARDLVQLTQNLPNDAT